MCLAEFTFGGRSDETDKCVTDMTVDCTIINAGSKSDFMGMCNSQQRTMCPYHPQVESALYCEFDDNQDLMIIKIRTTRGQNR